MDLVPPEPVNPEIQGARARALLDNPTFDEAVIKVREDLVRKWADTDPLDRETREACYFQVRALTETVKALQSFTRDARMERLRREKAS